MTEVTELALLPTREGGWLGLYREGEKYIITLRSKDPNLLLAQDVDNSQLASFVLKALESLAPLGVLVKEKERSG